MGRSKVVFGSDVLIDLTGDTVTDSALLSGYTAHDKAGNTITGTLVTQTCYVGSGVPSDTVGNDGDLYIDMG